MWEQRTNMAGREVSISRSFKLSRNVMTVVYDFCGHEEWLRMRQVCRLFDDASYSMAKWWPAWAKTTLKAHIAEEKVILNTENCREIIASIKEEMGPRFQEIMKHPQMKPRLISLFTERKTCFAVDRRWKPSGDKMSVAHNYKLTNVNIEHPIAHLQLIVICLIFTDQMPDQFKRLKATAQISNLGKILHSQHSSSIARKMTATEATLETHLLRLSSIECRQLDDLFKPGPSQKVTSHDKEVPKQIQLVQLDEDLFLRGRGIRFLFNAVHFLYVQLNELRERQLFRRLQIIKQQRNHMDRGLRYLTLIVNLGIVEKKLFRRRTDEEDRLKQAAGQ